MKKLKPVRAARQVLIEKQAAPVGMAGPRSRLLTVAGRGAIAFGALLSASPLACSDDDGDADATPIDVEGAYTLSVANDVNGCDFDNWDEDAVATNTPFSIEQDGKSITGTMEGIAGGVYELLLGNSTFEGEVSGTTLNMTLYGERAVQDGNCSFTVNAEFTATLSGDALEGMIDFTARTNNNPDCVDFEGCRTRQKLNGTRPPQ
jgi:hypothetical protein